MLRLFRVSGRSMLPTLRDGDLVIAWRSTRLRAGRIICIDTTHEGWLIKRLRCRHPARFYLDSDGQTGSENLPTVHDGDLHYVAFIAFGRGIRWLQTR
ncbi:MAG: S24 family peptidase [Pseudomonadota bacterium]